MNKLFSQFAFLLLVGATFFSCSNELNTVGKIGEPLNLN
uniref:Uncharacterized protein n=1 Tax=uncultured prokaryote TaxID=198431 RepID=A0A0H5Q0Z9_9ZZZZ|nr:hypothetical protein [uncultured prokaryote]